MSEHPIHGPVTISVMDDTRKLGEALERIARREALLKGILQDLRARGTDYREYARGYRASETWSLADDAAGRASGIFLAVRMIRKALAGDTE